MAQTINGGTAYIPGQSQTVDPDHDNPERANEGFTGTDPAYENAVDHTYAPQGDEELVPKPLAFGTTEESVSKEQVAANKAVVKADELQAKADAAAADAAAKAEAERIEAARVATEAAQPPVTPVTTSTTPSAPSAPSTDK